MNDRDRKRLIAFYRVESPWMVSKIEGLERGWIAPSEEDRRVLASLDRIAA